MSHIFHNNSESSYCDFGEPMPFCKSGCCTDIDSSSVTPSCSTDIDNHNALPFCKSGCCTDIDSSSVTSICKSKCCTESTSSDSETFSYKKKPFIKFPIFKKPKYSVKKLSKNKTESIKIIFCDILESGKPFYINTEVDLESSILFTSSKISIKINKLDIAIEIVNKCSTKSKKIIQGNIEIFNFDTGHMYSSIIVNDDNKLHSLVSNRPIVPLAIDFCGYIQLRLTIKKIE